MNMNNNLADTVEIIGQRKLIGTMANNLDVADRARVDAEEQAFKDRMAIRDVQDELYKVKSELRNKTLQHAEVQARLKQDLKEKDAVILEWMHAHKAFHRLARQYRIELGIDEVQGQQNAFKMIIAIAEEQPEFQNTEYLAKAKARLKT
jgi:hypothetical protein